MNPVDNDRRQDRQLSERALKLGINDDQLDTFAALERFGWSLKFVRASPAGPVAVIWDPDTKKLAVIHPDGRLDENPAANFRS